MLLSVLVIGGSTAIRGVVASDLVAYGLNPLFDEGVAADEYCAAVLLHPEALQLVAGYRVTVPVIVVCPDDDSLMEGYLREGVEEVLSTESVFNGGYVARAVRRALARRCNAATRERAARIDPLTELLNRRGLSEALGRVSKRQPGTVAMLIDIDDFKAVNERLGHAGGDDILRRVANTLLQHARPTDLVCRLGGDEYVVVLPGVGFVVGCAVAERLRRAIAELGVTASIGLATVDDAAETTLENLVSSTQWLLQNSKALGKNRVAVPEPAF